MSLPIYIDIDGTLTINGEKKSSKVVDSRIESVKKLISSGQKVVIWSANGCDYAKKFVIDNNIDAYMAIGKPQYCIDDKPTIRPNWIVKQPQVLG